MLVFELCCARRPGNDRVAVTAEDSFVLAVFVWIWQLFFFFWQGIVRFSSLLVGSFGWKFTSVSVFRTRVIGALG